jgi:hypothetical protein
LDVVLNEVLYDPEGADGGYEFVELASAPGVAPDAEVGGWTLETGNGSTGEWRIAWVGAAGQRLRGGLFVIGESGVDPRPDGTTDLDLQNGPDACRLRSPSGETDVLGWGRPLPPGFAEGESAADVAGASLARLPDAADTQNNGADFRAVPPSPGDYNAPAILALVESAEFPPVDLPPGAAWTFRAVVRNAGRAPWPGPVTLRCAVHPQELLGSLAPLVPLAPGGTAQIVTDASPPSGVHLPITDPPGPLAPPWRGIGADLAISEVHSHPASGAPEWVEIRCVADQTVRLDVFELRDAADGGGALNDVARSGAFVILTEDSARFVAHWSVPSGVQVIEPSSWPALNHAGSADEIVETISIRIQDPAGGPPRAVVTARLAGGSEEAVSWERISLGLSGEDPSSWARSLDPSGGTPGRANSRPADADVAAFRGALVITPSPFRPALGASALVVLRTERPASACTITVHDSAGSLVAQLAPWLGPEGEHRAVWDGRGWDGGPAPLGLYVIHARADGSPGRRAAVVLAR